MDTDTIQKTAADRGFYINPYKLKAIAELTAKLAKTTLDYGHTLDRAEMELALAEAADIINLRRADEDAN